MTAIPPTVPPSTPPPPGGGSYTPPPPPPPPAGGRPGNVSGDRTLMIVLSYLWILALIPLLVRKEDREVQWHAKNGLALTVAEVLVWVIFTILNFAMPSGMGLGCGMGVVQCVVWIGFLVLRVLAIMKGVKGERYRFPLVTDFADKM